MHSSQVYCVRSIIQLRNNQDRLNIYSTALLDCYCHPVAEQYITSPFLQPIKNTLHCFKGLSSEITSEHNQHDKVSNLNKLKH